MLSASSSDSEPFDHVDEDGRDLIQNTTAFVQENKKTDDSRARLPKEGSLVVAKTEPQPSPQRALHGGPQQQQRSAMEDVLLESSSAVAGTGQRRQRLLGQIEQRARQLKRPDLAAKVVQAQAATGKAQFDLLIALNSELRQLAASRSHSQAVLDRS